MTLHRTRTSALALGLALALATALGVPPLGPDPAAATPVATDAATYTRYGRVFPDPHGCMKGSPEASPWAEGNVCAADFIQFDEMVAGFEFLQTLAPEGGRAFAEFMDLQRLDEDYADVLNLADGDGLSAGLPRNDGSRLRSPLYMLKVTDSASDIPEADREHFVFALSVHGIERAGAEGGIRAAEDLVTWGATDPDRPLVPTDPTRSVTIGEALRRSVIYFIFPNPDGWIRGDTSRQGPFYQRYNGNGVDLNRDWPAQGFTFRPYTPLSEPESRSFAKVLKSIRAEWTGGNDLHGQLIDRAFSFTLIGSVTRPWDKNAEAVRAMRRIWADQETRLSWSPLIKPNSAPPSCVEPGTDPTVNPDPSCDASNRVYADQWGTIWDTIDYTVTGALGDWIDSPQGLNALGLDNEMSLSHLSNCGTGKCFDQDVEQLHVDGNKGLIYAQVNLALHETQDVFRQPGRTAYVVNPDRVRAAGSPPPADPPESNLPPQEDIDGAITQPPNTPLQFDVQGPADGVYNGGFTVRVTYQNVQGVSPGAVTGVVVERRRAEEPPPGEDPWEPVNSDYNQSEGYLQAGMTVNVNAPPPGAYRVRLDGEVPPGQHRVEIDFSSQQSWPDPGQLPYDVANTDFFTDLDPLSVEGFGFTALRVEDILGGGVDLDQFDSIVLADRFMPGWRVDLPPPPPNPAQDDLEGTSAAGAPGAGRRNAGTSTFFEFDVDPLANNGELRAVVEPQAPADMDLYLQRQRPDGTWTGDVAQGESSSLSSETLVYAKPPPGHYRLEMHNWAGPAANPLSITVSFTEPPEGDEPEPKRFTDAQRDAYLDEFAAFVRAGGNLVLTDGAMDALRYLDKPDAQEPLFPDVTDTDTGAVTPQVQPHLVYAGHIEFNDGEGPTYAEHDLAKDVNQPGAAEGDNNRHQTSEPIPTGYAIQNDTGSDLFSMPNWVVDTEAWEAAGGVTVGQSAELAGVSFGELGYGDGTIRIIGSVLPMPTDDFDHPYGLAAHGLTYSGYQVFDNALQYVRPGGTWRLAGLNRFETAVEVASRHWNTVPAVVIASGAGFADALAAAPLARALDAPILLTPKEGLDPATFEYLLSRNPAPARAYIVGGEGVVSDQVVDDLQRVRVPAEGIVRLSGSDRFSTAVAVARELATVLGTSPTTAVIATGERFPDALAAGPVAGNAGPAATSVPLLLVGSQTMPEVVADYLAEAGITDTIVAGGRAAIADEVLAVLPGPRRVSGPERYTTAVRLAELLAELRGAPAESATVATGSNFPDALVVGSPGGRDGIPTLLADPAGLEAVPPTREWLRANGAALRAVYIAGGFSVLPQTVATEIEVLTGR